MHTALDSSWETLIVEIERSVVTVTLNRPKRLNALSPWLNPQSLGPS